MHTQGVALENISFVSVMKYSVFEIYAGANATNNVEVIQVSEGGEIDINYDDGAVLGEFTPKAAYWPFTDMQGTEEESEDGYVHEPTSVLCENGTNTEGKYIMATESGHFSLQSTAKAMYNISSNIQESEDSVVVNGIARVIAANGYSQTFMGYTDYVIEEGTEVTIELLPDYGYQYASGGINGIPTMPDEGKATYKFTMPNNHIHLSAIFELSEDIIDVKSDNIADASIAIPQGEINGNAKLVIDDKTATSSEQQQIQSLVGDMSIGPVLDLKLSEEIAKNGSKTDTWSTNITDLNDNMDIELELDDSLAGFENYKVVRIHNGEPEILSARYDASTRALSFETDGFSTYAILHSGAQTITKSVNLDGKNIPVTITADEGVLPDGSNLTVDVISQTTQSDIYKLIKNSVGSIGSTFLPLNITLKDAEGNKIQPNGKITIKIKLPEGYTNPVVCYVTSEGKVTKLKTTVKDGYCTFETDHLSYYVLVNQQVVNTGDASSAVAMGSIATLALSGLIYLNYYKKKRFLNTSSNNYM